MIKAVGMILNRRNEEAVDCARKASLFFQQNGTDAFDMQRETSAKDPDLIITFGGDGTLLLGAQYAMEYGIPLMGVNLGTVGFLTETEPRRLEKSLQSIISGNYHTESRSVLEIQNHKTKTTHYALNDAVITRGGYARLIQVEAFVNNKEFGVFTADGIIVATPTGSTGYSMSAGGPIVEPAMDCMTITPVCAHSLQHCPCVVSAASRIRILLRQEREQTAELQIDGQNKGMLSSGDEVSISVADKKIMLIRFHDYDFFGLMRKKLIEWGS